MVNAAENSQAVSVAANTTAGNKDEEAGGDAFAKELASVMSDQDKNKERIAQTMERLAAVFPGVSVSSRAQTSFTGITDYYIKTGDDSSINISPQMLADMAENDELYTRVKDMISNLFSTGSQQKLVDAGGQNTHRNVTVEGETVRYAEVQRTAAGAQLSISYLTLESRQVVNDTLEQMLASRQQSSTQTISGQNQSQGFERFLLGSSTWRLQSFVSSQSLDRLLGTSTGNLSAANLIDRQMLTTSQSITANLEIVIQQWQADGGQLDLWTYMEVMGLADPLVLDLGDEGINLRSAEDGVYFDIKGDGTPVRTAFISGNNAFLYLDGNGNGIVDDANELFGDHGGFKNGYEKLAQYDDNGDGVIDERDAIYHRLGLWRDLNGDGVNQAEESMTLAEAGVRSLDLRHDNSQELDRHGNVIGERSSFTRMDGTQGLMADVWLRNL